MGADELPHIHLGINDEIQPVTLKQGLSRRPSAEVYRSAAPLDELGEYHNSPAHASRGPTSDAGSGAVSRIEPPDECADGVCVAAGLDRGGSAVAKDADYVSSFGRRPGAGSSTVMVTVSDAAL